MKSVYLEKLKYLNPFNMSNFNFNDCLKAMNKAQFRPTEYRKAKALELLWEAIEYVENLEVKSAKPKVICSDQLGKELSVDHNDDGSRTYHFGKPQRKASPKRSKAKVKRATPQQRVADRQEKLFHGKADSPVQPSRKAKKASVSKARKSAVQVSEATGATARAKAKQLAKAKAEAKELQKQLAATMEKLASLL